MRNLSLLLLVVFFLLQHSLWFGKNGIFDYLKIKNELTVLEILNLTFKLRNERLFNEINDLIVGWESIEERARTELGMIKLGESCYHIVQKKSFSNNK
ncbi:Cell division protein FtsB [Candidatus Arsenophonus lipoptenae]|uniref:Cell division protein FtsB n=1 Tax=Candidatus Arsenophonus lipoptenae TaxID=634113 RepID=A0A0X9W3H7_9GAMM|nr:cell division protein FtsB [Candidatus Arsenophonus lipoptenae]AMA65074.1 Cell division protein FtsB [Candidatus Arsenophonus lipoptenae]